MVKICDDSIKKPLSIIYKNCLTTGTYPNACKKSNIVPVRKKGVSNLLTITDQSHFFLFLVKFLRKSYLIPFLNTFKIIVSFLITNQVFHLLIHESINYFLLFMIFFDCNPPKDVRGIFLDISKAFNRVWHEGLIYKMKCIGITGMPLKLLQNFLQNRHQRVLVNGQCSSWAPVFAGVPQGSVFT